MSPAPASSLVTEWLATCYKWPGVRIFERRPYESPLVRELDPRAPAPQWRRLALPAIVLAALAVALVTALAVGPALLSAAAPTPTASPTPSPTPTPTPTQEPTPTPAPTPTPVPTPTAYTGPPTAAPATALTGYVWPLADAIITLPFGPSPFGEFIVNGKLFHDGVDMATPKCGDPILAAHDGTVLAAGRDYVDFMGWQGDLSAYKKLFSRPSYHDSLPIVIVIDDGDGYRSIYAHEYGVKVKPGQHVFAGQVIGSQGATGLATGCHLHFGLYSPYEKLTFQNLPRYVASMHLPTAETARIDPLLVLPYRDDVTEMRTLRPADAAAWAAAHPSAGPSPKK
jgi:murein DD-endopeptidase MepM/ murein hydrolase activator NlpD